MTYLLDANLLLALVLDTHVHHSRAQNWFSKKQPRFTTCSVTQGALLRLHMQFAEDSSSEAAWQTLEGICSHARHVFWDGNFSYEKLSPHFIQGHRQVTDAWLVELAKRQKGKLATFDKGLVANYPKLTFSVPSAD